MVFSSIPFLYYFLPVVVLLYFIVPRRISGGVLLLASLVFYGYGEPRYLALMVLAILAAWALGLLIPRSRAAFYLSVGVSLGLLLWFKYADFFVESFAAATGMALEPLGIALPIGISFYTFQILSYTIDVYRGRIRPQQNLLRFAMYVSMFPQLIAGPIVVYASVESQLSPQGRRISAVSVYEGARRFLVGLGKKAILANGLGELVQALEQTAAGEQSVAGCWLWVIGFTLQIYFDFSGYSDMAIGLGRIFAFSFPENFNYPYISRSVTEFWRRWHITLGSWFREYVYIPLGGNRVSAGRWIFNLFVVWLLTGLWHGAAWHFAVWGLFYGIILLIEKRWIGGLLKRIPAWLSHVYVMALVMIGWVLFQSDDLGQAAENLCGLVGLVPSAGGEGAGGAGHLPLLTPLTLYYIRNYLVLLLVSIFGCLPAAKGAWNRLAGRTGTAAGMDRGAETGNRTAAARARLSGAAAAAEPLLLAGLLLLVTAYLVDGSYNPFLYFRF